MVDRRADVGLGRSCLARLVPCPARTDPQLRLVLDGYARQDAQRPEHLMNALLID